MPLFRKNTLFIGETITGATNGSVLFANSGLSQNNSQLFWDNSNSRLGIGTAGPLADIEIMISSAADIGFMVQGAASQSGDLTQYLNSSGDQLLAIDPSGFIKVAPTNTTVVGQPTYIYKSSTTTLGNGGAISAVQYLGEFIYPAPPAFSALPGTFFQFGSNMRFTGTMTTYWGFGVYTNQGIFIADGVTLTASLNLAPHFWDTPAYSIANSGSWGTTALYQAFLSAMTVNTGVTWGERRAFRVSDATGAGSLTTQVGLDVVTLTKASNNYAIRTGASGEIRFGNKITLYNNIATVSGGVPSELATVDLTGQTAAIAATTIYTPAATGMFRVSAYLQVTTAATVSSVLGGATGMVITYNDGDGNVAQSRTMALTTSAGTVVTTVNTNTTATNLEGGEVIYARTGVAITYAIGYTSVGAQAMNYAVHLKVEAL